MAVRARDIVDVHDRKQVAALAQVVDRQIRRKRWPRTEIDEAVRRTMAAWDQYEQEGRK